MPAVSEKHPWAVTFLPCGSCGNHFPYLDTVLIVGYGDGTSTIVHGRTWNKNLRCPACKEEDPDAGGQ